MIDTQIVSAIIRRYIYTLRHDLNSFTDAFYQPAMQIFIWGLTSSYIQRESNNLPQIVLVILSGVVFWMILSQSTQDITIGLLREFWDRNLVNLFSSPLRLREWIVGVVITGTISYNNLFISFALNITYLLLSLWFFVKMFEKSHKLGLGRLI